MLVTTVRVDDMRLSKRLLVADVVFRLSLVLRTRHSRASVDARVMTAEVVAVMTRMMTKVVQAVTKRVVSSMVTVMAVPMPMVFSGVSR